MRIILFLLSFSILVAATSQKWGKTGHRAVGNIAADYLNPEAQNAVNRILGHESMAIASTWMDEIRSDPAYDYTHDWHWVTIPEGMTYAETEKNPNGDIIKAIRTLTRDLSDPNISEQEEEEKLKMLIHLIGDIHMPLHVGTGEDQGGNNLKVRWFSESSNLHRVWDSNMIEEYNLSYTELAASINHPSEKQIRKWQRDDVIDWARESKVLRDRVYRLPDDKNLRYRYMYHNFDTVERRLLQAGVRLAGVLNEIYKGR